MDNLLQKTKATSKRQQQMAHTCLSHIKGSERGIKSGQHKIEQQENLSPLIYNQIKRLLNNRTHFLSVSILFLFFCVDNLTFKIKNNEII